MNREYASPVSAVSASPGPPEEGAGLALALALCGEGILMVAAQAPYPVQYVNAALCRRAGRTAAELLGQALPALADDGAGHLAAALQAADGSAAEQAISLRSPLIDHGQVWSDWRIAGARGADGRLARIVCVVDDTTEQQIQMRKLADLATHDSVTGLPNRELFKHRLQAAMADAGPAGRHVAVLCLALDGFSLVNETYGYTAGDQLLVSASQRLQACLGRDDTLSRHGGNQFVIMMARLDPQGALDAACEQIFQIMAPPFALAGQPLEAACSLGVARYPQDSGDSLTLLRYAEIAMHQAHLQGGKRCQFFTADMSERLAQRASMEAAMRLALGSDQLRLQYQPLADLQQGTICALEALVRWEHPQLGMIDAGRFIPLAEEAGLTTALGYWAMRQAVRDLQAWRDAGLPPVQVAINVSPKQFNDPGLEQAIGAALRHSGLEPDCLALEFTEAALLAHGDAGAGTLARLKVLGVGLTLDDFGTGYSALNHLQRFPIDELKIDGALTARLAAGADEAALVKTIIAMAHHLGIRVTAEGVETEAQCDFLRRNMCDRIQGYFFGAPADAGQIAALLAAGHAVPPHLLRIQRQERTLLLVDDEQNIVSALKRLLRRDGYRIVSANSGQEGLDVLAANEVDVIVSDQRMPGMIGADFLRAAKSLYPDTIRIMLSGYTELQSVTDAVNEGAIFKFLTKPWDDEQLRGHIAEAFRLKEIADDNERLNLALRTANHELAAANRRMEELLRQKQQQITRDEISLNVARDLLQFVPLAVLGIDEDGMVAFINGAAETLLRSYGSLLGDQAALVLPALFEGGAGPGQARRVAIAGRPCEVVFHPMGRASQSRGNLITIHPSEERA